jgi:tetratricopeptide (TPR) repeat protein
MGKYKLVIVVSLAAIFFTATVARTETNVVSTTVSQSAEDEAAWSRRAAQEYQQLQEQQQATQRSLEEAKQQAAATARAVEIARQDADAAAKRNAETLEAKLKQIEDAVTVQRQREVETLQSSHRLTLIVVGLFAGVGFFGMLFFAVFLLRSMNRRVAAASTQPIGAPLGQSYTAAALGTGDTQLATADSTHQSSQRFLSTIDRLEKRMNELETTAQVADSGQPIASKPSATETIAGETQSARPTFELSARIALLLGKGQTLLNLQQADRALECFDEVIALDGTNGEAFVKKGTALEKLGRLDEAIDCYDRAIAADTSMTMAYLCKGGVFNRLERYGEALQCYEQALRAQQKVSVA